LALWQARFTQSLLENQGISSSLTIIKTKGDVTHHLSFDKLEGKGFFTKEIEDALLAGEVDLAVHSCKDMPTENTPGLILSAYSARVNPSDILLIHPDAYDGTQHLSLRANAIIATSSSRRKNQIRALRPDISFKDIRGNVPTRIQKLRDAYADATVLAAAGIERLEADVSGLIVITLAPPMCIPAPAQGILAYQIRSNDAQMMEVSKLLADEQSKAIVDVERQLLHAFGGGCQVPIGIYAKPHEQGIHTWVSYAKAATDEPKRYYGYISNTQHIDIKGIIDNILQPKSFSVFISRSVHNEEYLSRLLTGNGYTFQGESWIDFEAVSFDHKLLSKGDILFFSSKNGFAYFEQQFTDKAEINSYVLAAINVGTANYIRSKGYVVAFQGTDGIAEKLGVDFEAFIATKKSPNAQVWFPCAKNSLRTVQQLLPQDLANDIIVYSNTPKIKILKRNEDIIVFTSPMNVKAYTALHPIEKHQNIVAIGTSTSHALQSAGYDDVHIAYAPTPWSLADAIMSIS
jgi:hydroxymethylbilane synthase